MSIQTLPYYACEEKQEIKHLSVSRSILLPNSPSHLKSKRFYHLCEQLTTFSAICKTMQFCMNWGHCLPDPQSSLTKFKLYHLHQRGWWWLATYLSCSAAALDGRMPSCGEPPADGENCMYLPAISNLCPVSNSTLPLLDFYRPPIAIRSFNSLHSSATTATRTSPTQFPRVFPSFLPQDGDLNPTPAEWMRNV